MCQFRETESVCDLHMLQTFRRVLKGREETRTWGKRNGEWSNNGREYANSATYFRSHRFWRSSRCFKLVLKHMQKDNKHIQANKHIVQQHGFPLSPAAASQFAVPCSPSPNCLFVPPSKSPFHLSPLPCPSFRISSSASRMPSRTSWLRSSFRSPARSLGCSNCACTYFGSIEGA